MGKPPVNAFNQNDMIEICKSISQGNGHERKGINGWLFSSSKRENEK